jgi:tetratricopeptide (TPR) repeat protein
VFIRAIVWYLNGLSGKAIELLQEELEKNPPVANPNLEKVQVVIADKGLTLHLGLSILLLEEGKYLEADKHLAIAVQLMPDDEFIKLIQSESAAVQGDAEKAVQLAESCKTSDNQWLKELASRRVQEVRDNPLKHDRLFADPQFVLKLLAAFCHKAAKESEAMAKIENLFAAAQDFSTRWSPAKIQNSESSRQ